MASSPSARLRIRSFVVGSLSFVAGSLDHEA
jgi:hypothetical protein